MTGGRAGQHKAKLAEVHLRLRGLNWLKNESETDKKKGMLSRVDSDGIKIQTQIKAAKRRMSVDKQISFTGHVEENMLTKMPSTLYGVRLDEILVDS